MKIGINGFEAVVPRFGYDKTTGLPNRVGSSEVCFQLLNQFSKIDKKNEYIVYLPQKPTEDMPKENDNWKYEVIPNTKLWTIFGLNRKLITNSKLDVFFSSTHYGPLYTHCPQVISILDVSYKYFPEMFRRIDLLKLALWGKYSIKKAQKIITISDSSKNDIINEYNIDPRKISVVYPGLKFEVQNHKSEINSKLKMQNSKLLKEKYNINSPYILFVGTLQPRKNIVRLVEAFAELTTKNLKLKSDLDLVIVGRRGWNYEEILEAPKKFGVEKKVRFIENVTDNDLPTFYKNADVFVLPSLYEGFGLPVLEAMRYGCPVLTSNISSLPEAGGDAAIYFNPNDTNDIADKINKVLGDEKLREEMIEKGYEQVKKFSWEKSAREVLQVLEETVKPV